jgi:prepilin-type N-terminal cleavage/methylation domain-containing protein
MAAPARFREGGFSLLELVISMVLTALLAVIAMQPVLRALQARSRVAGNLAAIDALRFATERMVRELRQVRYDAQGSGFQLAALAPIAGTTSASNGLCFTRVGGSAGATYASLALRQTGTTATLDAVSWPGCTASAPKTLADRVSSLRFDYWSHGSGAPVALALNDAAFGTRLAFIDITLSVTPNDGPAVSYRSRVVLRNGAWGAAK